MKQLALLILLALAGCESITPIAKIEHTSHITQHFGNNRTNYGWNTVGFGIQFKAEGCTIQAVDNYSFEPVDGRHEVFTAGMVCSLGKLED